MNPVIIFLVLSIGLNQVYSDDLFSSMSKMIDLTETQKQVIKSMKDLLDIQYEKLNQARK